MDLDLIEKKYKNLSRKQRDLFFSEEIGIILDSICESFNLTEEAGDLLSDEIGLVIMDINKQDTFGDNLADSLHISEEVAKKVTAEVKNIIFDAFLRNTTTDIHENIPPTGDADGEKTDVSNTTEIESDIVLSQIPEAPKDLKEKLELRPDEIQSPQTEGVIPEAPKDLKEKLELRPEDAQVSEAGGKAGVRPLTREEVLRALAPARTMAGDIASLEKQSSTASDIPHVTPKAKL